MPQVHIPGVGLVEFPDSMSGDEIASAAKRLHEGANPPERPGSNSSLLTNLASRSVPAVQRVVEEVATNPLAKDVGQGVGRLVGGGGGLHSGGYVGMKTGEAVGSAVGRGAADVVQRGAGSVAGLLERLAPYAQALSTASGAQGVLDLAQMAEPTRRDIGVMGVSMGDAPRSDAEQTAHPALINMLLQKLLSLGHP